MSGTVDVARELAHLRDFQRRTVDYVFRRLYEDERPSRRFLVADEVGLGKTMVARGVIAKAIAHLEGRVDRVDVIYVCSNAAIAHQNLKRLNVLGDDHPRFATRLTLLPVQLESLTRQRINFVSFTPGTTFDLKSRGGVMQERAVLYFMLDGAFGLRSTPLRNLLQASAGHESWARFLASFAAPISPDLVERFHEALDGSPTLGRLEAACERFARRRERVPGEDSELRYQVIGELRHMLARVCVDALEPDLVILDEFQRFKDILDGRDEAAELARHLFDYPEARVLLLSATPYRMLTLAHEQQDDHHTDFLRTYRFLVSDDEGAVEALERDLAAFRRALLGTHEDAVDEARRARAAIEERLRRVMSRIERVGMTQKLDAMVVDRAIHAPLAPEDVDHALVADRVARALGLGDVVEYWKSAPYLLSFMQRYELKEKLRAQADDPSDALLSALKQPGRALLEKETISKYRPVPFANARLRALAQDTLEAGQWRLLWLPPSVPYLQPTGPYAEVDARGHTKALVFSSWTVVPEAIATLMSYEAERRMLGELGEQIRYERLRTARKPLLTFRVDADGRPTGMPALALLYPSVVLAEHVDPLAIALDVGDGEPAALDAVRAHIARRLGALVDTMVARHGTGATSGPVDQRWYWALPVLLDVRRSPATLDWIDSEKGLRGLFREDDEQDVDVPSLREEGESRSGFDRHVDELLAVARGSERLGRRPDDLLDVMTSFALASPAICAMRSLRRVTGAESTEHDTVRTAAAEVAKGFRVLFNVPETMELLRAGEDAHEAYWRSVLGYCVDGNLQAVLDEYAHLLVDAEGLTASATESKATTIARAMVHALSPRTATLAFDDIDVKPNARRIELRDVRVRTRFAMRFGDLRDERDSTLARADVVRAAFNSPFRPFVLASTSIGQEGLDFHHYCHAVVHWNLPSNPVDLEQREGRVHRYKGHAVRRNVAHRFGLEALRRRWDGTGDPWARLFELAAAERPPGSSDLHPYWVCEGPQAVERRIPLLPLSREHAQLARLKRNLALYRVVFGQPRQEDLLAFLASVPADRERDLDLEKWRISLAPPYEPAAE